METKERYTTENVLVYPIDIKKLNSTLNSFMHEKIQDSPKDALYEVHGKLAIMRHPKECVIDDEFVGHDIKNKITFYIYKSQSNTHECFPSYEVTLTLQELKTYLQNSITLAEFTKDRRGYNSRIRANEAEWIKYLNK